MTGVRVVEGWRSRLERQETEAEERVRSSTRRKLTHRERIELADRYLHGAVKDPRGYVSALARMTAMKGSAHAKETLEAIRARRRGVEEQEDLGAVAARNDAMRESHYREWRRARHRLEQARYRERHPDRTKEAVKKYREANPDKIREGKRAWVEKNADYVRASKREWREKNKDYIRAHKLAWNMANREKQREYGRRYRVKLKALAASN